MFASWCPGERFLVRITGMSPYTWRAAFWLLAAWCGGVALFFCRLLGLLLARWAALVFPLRRAGLQSLSGLALCPLHSEASSACRLASLARCLSALAWRRFFKLF